MAFTLVTGPPCSGKSSYVNSRRGDLDIVIDQDVLIQALGSKVTHGHAIPYIQLGFAAKIAVLKEMAFVGSKGANVWYISCWPTLKERQFLPPKTVHVPMTATQQQCKQWATDSGRPPMYQDLIDKWFEDRKPK